MLQVLVATLLGRHPTTPSSTEVPNHRKLSATCSVGDCHPPKPRRICNFPGCGERSRRVLHKLNVTTPKFSSTGFFTPSSLHTDLTLLLSPVVLDRAKSAFYWVFGVRYLKGYFVNDCFWQIHVTKPDEWWTGGALGIRKYKQMRVFVVTKLGADAYNFHQRRLNLLFIYFMS